MCDISDIYWERLISAGCRWYNCLQKSEGTE